MNTDNPIPKPALNTFCPGIDLGDGNHSGCSCDCPTCAQAHADSATLHDQVRQLRNAIQAIPELNLSNYNEHDIHDLYLTVIDALKTAERFKPIVLTAETRNTMTAEERAHLRETQPPEATMEPADSIPDLLRDVQMHIQADHIDWARFQHGSPDYDPTYKPEFPPIVHRIDAARKRLATEQKEPK